MPTRATKAEQVNIRLVVDNPQAEQTKASAPADNEDQNGDANADARDSSEDVHESVLNMGSRSVGNRPTARSKQG